MNHLLLPQRELKRFLSSSASRWFTKIKSLADHFHDNVTHFGRKKNCALFAMYPNSEYELAFMFIY